MKTIALLSALMILWVGVGYASEIDNSVGESPATETVSENPPEEWWPPDWPIPPQIPSDENTVPEPSSLWLTCFCGWILYRRYRHIAGR